MRGCAVAAGDAVILPIPDSNPVAHGEGNSPPGVEYWAIGYQDGAVVYIDMDGLGYSERDGTWTGMGRLCDVMPDLPADDNDGPGWEEWARVIRDEINGPQPQQQTLF